MQLMLEALIHNNDTALLGAQVFGLDSDYLKDLKPDLTTTLERYKNRHNEFHNSGS